MLLEFWKENIKNWIHNDYEFDKLVYDTFSNINIIQLNWIEQIIYYDQLSCHFQRILKNKYLENINIQRKMAYFIFLDNFDQIRTLDEFELIIVLFPLKHLKKYDCIFEIIHHIWLKNKKIKNCAYLHKFYIDTYNKYYCFDYIKKSIILSKFTNTYSKFIFEYYPDKYSDLDWNLKLNDFNDSILKNLHIFQNKKIMISLSGGVDSMVLLTLCKILKYDVIAFHLIYGNRYECGDELYFLTEFCNKLNIPLYTYNIKWIRRDNIEREDYEIITRRIRFDLYNCLCENIILGHIQDDIIENIWNNITKCQHIDNLKKMTIKDKQNDVFIYRPFLNIKKDKIIHIAHQLNIPYFKNTTPIWSNRGKFRNQFYSEIQKQFGNSIDDKIIQFSEIIENQNYLLIKYLYIPILNSFKNMILYIEYEKYMDLKDADWIYIFENICYNKLKLKKPGLKSIKYFSKHKPINQRFEMTKQFYLYIHQMSFNISIQFFIKVAYTK
jgi:tRNA(Ile)-lysidine synthetase-like protein